MRTIFKNAHKIAKSNTIQCFECKVMVPRDLSQELSVHREIAQEQRFTSDNQYFYNRELNVNRHSPYRVYLLWCLRSDVWQDVRLLEQNLPDSLISYPVVLRVRKNSQENCPYNAFLQFALRLRRVNQAGEKLHPEMILARLSKSEIYSWILAFTFYMEFCI